MGPASYFLHIGIDPQDHVAEHNQNIKAIKISKYNLQTYTIMSHNVTCDIFCVGMFILITQRPSNITQT
jgi:hypothetical protein